MSKRIVVIQGHPDPCGHRYGNALSAMYTQGAREAGYIVDTIDVARLDCPLLHTKQEWESGPPPEAVVAAQKQISAADHLVIFYPLWLGSMPALLKGFLEQVFRPDFVTRRLRARTRAKAKTARVVVTMGMPAFVYRWYFLAHGLRNLRRNILAFSGIQPVRETLIGQIESSNSESRRKWLFRMRDLGAAGA